jgi:Phage tail tube protein
MSGSISSTARRIAGDSKIAINGTYYDFEEASYDSCSELRETLKALNCVPGYKSTPIAGYIDITMYDNGGYDTASLNAMSNVNITVELANGKGIIFTGVWQVGPINPKNSTGTFDIRFEGDLVFSQLSS